MRLTPDQAEAIRSSVHLHMGMQSRIWLFGSRVDDKRRGGDVDLYVEPESTPALMDCLRCKVALADALHLNVDLIVQQPGCDLPIYRIARHHGVPL
jgi:predicted nucleotidyltransferase